MSTNGGSWSVLEHGPIEKLSENLWRVEGSLPGMSLKRMMAVARRSDGRLVVHSAIALNEGAMKELEAWGEIAFLVVPNGWHRLDAPAFKARYPNVKVLAPKGAQKKVEEKVKLDGTLEDYPADPAVKLEYLHGIAEQEGAMIVHSTDGTSVVLTDAIFNLPAKPSDFFGWVFTSVFASAPGPRVSRLFKLAAVKDKKALRADFERFAALPDLTRVLVGHGDVARGANAAQALKAAAGFL
ncbi:MAG TPA: hypothetical protein VGI39_33100 [Polyangiaceae bacterium]|jgi:hypothetical protein